MERVRHLQELNDGARTDDIAGVGHESSVAGLNLSVHVRNEGVPDAGVLRALERAGVVGQQLRRAPRAVVRGAVVLLPAVCADTSVAAIVVGRVPEREELDGHVTLVSEGRRAVHVDVVFQARAGAVGGACGVTVVLIDG